MRGSLGGETGVPPEVSEYVEASIMEAGAQPLSYTDVASCQWMTKVEEELTYHMYSMEILCIGTCIQSMEESQMFRQMF